MHLFSLHQLSRLSNYFVVCFLNVYLMELEADVFVVIETLGQVFITAVNQFIGYQPAGARHCTGKIFIG